MLSAYISDLDGVQEAEDITGPYDIIAKIQAPSLDQLGWLVASRIQAVDGVTRTLTCMVIRR
jgi:DNA-binding Lrp family transcriptional regulator